MLENQNKLISDIEVSIEHYILKLIELKTPKEFSWEDSKLTFYQKLKIISKLPALLDNDLITGIEALNQIRNKFSHNLLAKIDNKQIEKIKKSILKFRIKHKKEEGSETDVVEFLELYDDIALIESFTSLVCAFIAGYCSTLIKKQKI
jgi:hypothetical protein